MKKTLQQEAPKSNPLSCVEIIARMASDSLLSEEFMKNVKFPARKLAWYLESNQMQAILFSVICNINFSHRAVGIDRIAEWLGCTPIAVAMHVNELEGLRRRNILRKVPGENQYESGTDTSIASICYDINPEVFEALRMGEKFVKAKICIRDNFELIKAVAGFIQQRAEGQIDFKEMEREIKYILTENSKMEFLKELNRILLTDKERILFLNLCDEYYGGCTTSNLPSMVKLVTSDKREQMSMRHSIASGYSGLNHSDLVECGEAGFRNDIEISLTDKALGMILKDDPKIVIDKKEIKMPDVMISEAIQEKKLYFTPEVQERYSEISELLLPANYDKLVKRLRKNGMKTGFAMLFEGPPGTGKTESVYQLARLSGRNIFQVTISSLKSKWYGDSEKLIKNLFDRYRKLAEKSEIIPLLLFNEADGVFSTRKTKGDSSVDQTENAIQNIILQELEDLTGILIATTNLMENLDRAFDRRFMFKVHFGKPTTEARFRIWQEKIPFLTDTAALELAEEYELSGGQIDNIARKCTMHRVLKGKSPVRMQIDSWCTEETGVKEPKRIGYRI
ncbi:MAG: ATP-binding protein [Bacteroidetes bacterium]|nr:ATP-binding protein [Bacteroidota bacterium]